MSYQDPEELYGRLAAGDSGRIAAAADPITGAVSALGRARTSIDQGHQTAVAQWRGGSADAFADRARLAGTATSLAADRLGAGGQVVAAAAGAYTRMRASADRAIAVWRSASPGLPAAQREALAQRVNAALTQAGDGYQTALRGYAAALGRVRPAFAETAGGTAAWQGATQRAAVSVPGPNASPQDVSRWWAGLTPEQRADLLRTRFQDLGKLRGLPADVLDQANRARLADDQRRFAADRDAVNAQLATRARALGLNPADEQALRNSNDPQLAALLDQRATDDRNLTNTQKAVSSLAHAEQLAASRGFPDKPLLLTWDPSGTGGKGAMAVAFGNPDTAKNLAVCVPGTGSNVGGFSLDQAANLRQQMGASGNATIQWLDYDAPTWDPSQVANPAQAQAGGANLVADVNGYRAAAEAAGNHQHLTVIGHSYGSTTVGYAGMHGLAADDIAFVGSPGVGASNVHQLSPGPGHVFAGATNHDPVVQATGSSWFTQGGQATGPYDSSFGATVFGTHDTSNIAHAHSAYYDQGSESLDNLAKIADGHGDQVTHQSWLDSPRGPHLPGSNVPVAGAVVDAGGGLVKDGVDAGRDLGSGGGHVASDLWHGQWSQAGHDALGTATSVGNDALDAVVGTVGEVGAAGKQAAGLWDRTIGRLF